MLQAAELHQSVYKTNWYEDPTQNSGFLIMTMVITERPVVFTAYDLFDVNMMTFANVRMSERRLGKYENVLHRGCSSAKIIKYWNQILYSL